MPIIRERLERCIAAGANMLVPGLKALLALAVAAAGDPAEGLAVLDDAADPVAVGVIGRRSFGRAVIELALGHDDRAEAILTESSGARGPGGQAGEVSRDRCRARHDRGPSRRDEGTPAAGSRGAGRGRGHGPFPMLDGRRGACLGHGGRARGRPDGSGPAPRRGRRRCWPPSPRPARPSPPCVGATGSRRISASELGAEAFDRAWTRAARSPPTSSWPTSPGPAAVTDGRPQAGTA